MKSNTAKTLRTIILVAWTIVMASMLAGVVYRLTKIIKDSSREQ